MYVLCDFRELWQTPAANTLLSDVHDRMPVIMEPENYDIWLDPGFRRAGDLLDLLKPYQPDAMRRYRVSSRVNSVQNDDAACVEEFSPQMLF
jgi:putative SOS response-associated peptidase YedK